MPSKRKKNRAAAAAEARLLAGNPAGKVAVMDVATQELTAPREQTDPRVDVDPASHPGTAPRVRANGLSVADYPVGRVLDDLTRLYGLPPYEGEARIRVAEAVSDYLLKGAK